MPVQILYIGPLWQGGTCLQRMKALERLGCRIVPFDTTSYLEAGSRIQRSLAHRLTWGPAIQRLNRDLCRQSTQRRCDWVWIDKGTWIYPHTVETLRESTGACMVHYTPDPAILFHRTRHFIAAIPSYDVLITSKGWEIEHYKRHGAREIVLLPQGYDRDIFRPREVRGAAAAGLQSDVCFVGHFETNYCQRIRAASKAVAAGKLAVWGRWQRAEFIRPWLRNVVRGAGVWGEDYANAICCSKIGLGLLSKWIPETSTTRTFEIPACGTFLLAERTDEHASFFDEGREAEFFDSNEELQDKVKYYLRHENARRQIAGAGRQRCLRSGYSYDDRMRQALESLRPMQPCLARQGRGCPSVADRDVFAA